MANKNILTSTSKVAQIEQVYYSPVAVVPPSNKPFGTTYCFLSKVDPWANNTNIPEPTGDQRYIKQTFKNMFAAKLITTSDISPVIQRIDWSSGTVYDYYVDDVDMSIRDQNGRLLKSYYVKNKYDQVFKCLWNNNDAQSTVEPYFEPGTYNTNNIFQGADGYKWKFIYTIDTGLKVKFMDDTWLPVPVGANTPNPLQSSAGSGSIDVINVSSGGFGYDPANAIIYVTVTGDGSGLTATANVVNGSINDIIVSSPGGNYTYADVTITSSKGTGAVAFAPTSPVGGHGFDPISELSAAHVMYTCQFNGSEGGTIPTNNDYHQVGLLMGPVTYESSPYAANGSIYRTTTDFVVAAGFGIYEEDEIIYQGTTLETATFTARILSFDTFTNVLYLINTTGTPTTNAPVFGNTSKTTRTLLSYSNSNFVPFSGSIAMIENRSAVQRSDDGIEQFRFVLGY